jgi:hypothetical protein
VAATALSVADPLVGLGLTAQPAQARGAAIAGDPAAKADRTKVAAAVTPLAFRAIHDGMSAPLAVSVCQSGATHNHAKAVLSDLACIDHNGAARKLCQRGYTTTQLGDRFPRSRFRCTAAVRQPAAQPRT